MAYDLEAIETELKKRLPYKNKWFRKQNDHWDDETKFIYKINTWDELIAQIAATWKANDFEKEPYFYYAINRWYNFWSAQAIEQIITDMPGLAANPNPVQDHYDFKWLGEPFDHKTSVFPKGFGYDYAFAKAHPVQLITWFYNEQSKGQRYHLNNRLFVVVYDKNGDHYKLKSEIKLLREAIETHMKDRTPGQTYTVNLETGKETKADIIWVTR